MNDNVKVRRDGTVLVNGERCGTVTRSADAMSKYGFSSGLPGASRWTPRGRDGKALAGSTKRRCDAVDVVVACCAPPKVTNMGVDDYYGRALWAAFLHVSGYVIGASRFADESGWHAYYQQVPGAFMPSECSAPHVRPARVIIRADMVALLNGAARDAGAPFAP